jgi:anti-sigma factor RsiW
VAAYVAGDLGDADRDAVDRHLDGCGACQDRVADLIADAAVAEGFDGHEPSPELRDRVLATIESTPQEQDPPPGQSDPGDRDAPGSDGWC